MIAIRLAVAGEADALSALVLRSKAHRGYSRAFMAAVVDELRVTEVSLADAAAPTWVAADAEHLLGMARLAGAAPTGEVAMLFVDPDAMGQGVGRRLVDVLVAEARRRGMTAVDLDADPGAEPFYARMGAQRVGETPSGSIPGRTLPRMRIPL